MHKKITDEEYFGSPEVNQSLIKDIVTMSPLAFQYKRHQPSLSTAATSFGSLVHCMILEPKEVHKRYATFEFDASRLTKEYKNIKATKEYKEQYCRFLDDNEGKEVVDLETMASASIASKALLKEVPGLSWHEITMHADTELAIFQKMYDFDCKGKVDYIDVDSALLIDVKTTADSLDDASLHRHLYKWHFPIQSAFYLELAKQEFDKDFTMAFAFVQSVAPYDTRTMFVSQDLTPDFLAAGKEKIKAGFDMLKLYTDDPSTFLETMPYLPDFVPAWY